MDPDEPVGAVLVLNKQKLRARYRLEPTHDPFWDDIHKNDEAEETVWGQDVADLRSMLLGVVWTDGQVTSTVWQPSSASRGQTRAKRLMRNQLQELLTVVNKELTQRSEAA